MAVVWLFRFKAKKQRAIIMAAAFIAMALFMYLIREQASQMYIVGAGVLLFALLAVDVSLRTAESVKDNEDEEQ